MSKPLTEMSFDELVEHNTQLIHSGLLESGGKGFKSGVYMSMDLTLRWKKETTYNKRSIIKQESRKKRKTVVRGKKIGISALYYR